MPPRRKSSAKKRKADELQDGAGPSAEPEVPAAAEGESEEERLKKALEMLLAAIDNAVDADKATAALMATSKSAEGDLEAWAEEAMLWLAQNQEVEDEGAEMGAAMQESLAEEEARKQSEKPIAERTGQDIVAHFAGSEMLGVAGAAVGGDAALPAALDAAAPEGKKTLVDYLLMEQRCKKWYTCSRKYFAQAAEQARERAAAAAAAADPPEGGGAGEGGDRAAPAIPEPLLAFLSEQLAALQEAVYARPPSDTELVPAIFAAHASQEEVVLLE